MTLNYQDLYSEIHRRGKGKHYAGKVRGVDAVCDLVKRVDPRRLLDYGSGKGYQYLLERQHEKWGGPMPFCYDVGVRQLTKRPEGKFDGIINCDMMEHIAESDVDAVLDDIFGFASTDHDAFVYFHISCTPSQVFFPDGRNVHLTQQPPEWWNAKLERVWAGGKFKRPGLIIEAVYQQ